MSTEPVGATRSLARVRSIYPDGVDPSEEAVDVGISSDDQVWRLATALSGAATPVEVAVALAEEGAGAAGASFANMAVLDSDNDRLRVVHASVLAPEIAARWSEFALTEPTPLCEAVRYGLPVLLGSPEAIGARYPDLMVDTLASGLAATASLPVLPRVG